MKNLRWTLATLLALSVASLAPAAAGLGADTVVSEASKAVSSTSTSSLLVGSDVAADTAAGPGATTIVTSASTAAAAAAVTNEEILYVRAVIIAQTNEQRAAYGLPALIEHPDLDNIAWRCSNIQAANDVMAHCEDYYTLYPAGWYAGGENVAYGQTPETVVAAWMASPGHQANILNPSYTHIGVGYNRSASGAPYYTQDFAGY